MYNGCTVDLIVVSVCCVCVCVCVCVRQCGGGGGSEEAGGGWEGTGAGQGTQPGPPDTIGQPQGICSLHVSTVLYMIQVYTVQERNMHMYMYNIILYM